VFADLRHVDAVLSTYRDSSDLSRWRIPIAEKAKPRKTIGPLIGSR
jgi:hypothetical protein